MFNPKYTINTRILKNVKNIAVLISELNSKRYPKIIFVEMERSARALSAFSSTSIEGNPLPLSEVKKILNQAPKHARDTEKEILNYNKVLEYLEGLQNPDAKSLDLDLILKIQKMVTNELIAPHRSGKLRIESVFVNDPQKRKVIYLPPDHTDVRMLVNDLIFFVKENSRSIDPLILAGIFHRQCVIIHPFMDGNGRTTRLATKVLLRNMGVDTFNLFSFENYYNRNVSAYFKAVGLKGNYYELSNTDFTDWLEYFTDGVIDELNRVKKELEKQKRLPEYGLRSAHEIILKYIDRKGSMTDRQYSGLTKRAKATRALDWKKLIRLGMIERVGKGKNTYYIKKP